MHAKQNLTKFGMSDKIWAFSLSHFLGGVFKLLHCRYVRVLIEDFDIFFIDAVSLKVD